MLGNRRRRIHRSETAAARGSRPTPGRGEAAAGGRPERPQKVEPARRVGGRKKDPR